VEGGDMVGGSRMERLQTAKRTEKIQLFGEEKFIAKGLNIKFYWEV
jgi:hypothetical protein